MKNPIKILHLEDLATDAELIKNVLKKGDFEFDLCLVQNRKEYEAELEIFCPDIIISDHSLPSFDSIGALEVLKAKKLTLPFILVTSAISEEFAVMIMKLGADDYILKDRLQRLPNAVLSAIEKRRIEIEHQKFLDELIVNEALLKETEQLAGIGSFKIDLINNTRKWSEELYRILDYNSQDLLPSFESFLMRVHPDDFMRVSQIYEDAFSRASSAQFDYRIITSRGTVKYIHSELFVKTNQDGKPIQGKGFIQDVTHHKRSEEKIMKAYRLYAFISQINQLIIHSDDEQIVFKEVCRIGIETGKFKIAWIGIIDNATKKINLAQGYGAPADDLREYLNSAYEKNGAKDYIIRMNTYYVSNNIQKDPTLSNSASFAFARGVGSCMMLPIKKNDTVYGILNLYASETNFFDMEEIKLLEEVSGDISYALDNFEKERQRKEAEEKLAHSQAILKEAQAIAHIGHWELDFSTGISFWSEETCRIYGLQEEESVQSFESWLSFIHAHDVEFVEKKIKTAIESLSDASFHHRIIQKDGGIRHIHSKTQIHFNEAGKPAGMKGIAHDITEEKRAEITLREKELYLRGILDSTDNGILAVDNNNHIINFNSPFTELWNIPSQLMKKKDDNAILEHLGSQLADPQTFITKIKGPYNLDGTSFDTLDFKDGRIIESFSTPLKLHNDFVGRVWSFSDISERRKHLKAIEEQNEKLREIAWEQSHVARAPLSRMMGLINLIKDDSANKSVNPELLDYLCSSATELDDIIRSIVLKTKEIVNNEA